nr:PIG-L deacetylase family protein [uncultured Methanolobus sp.]
MTNRTILAIGAHPDDIEIGCGGTIKKHIENGDSVYYSIATGGEKGGEKEIRIKEAERAADIMGVEGVEFMDLKDTFISHDGNTIAILDRIMQRIRPSIVYVHSLNDFHQDHINIAKSVLSASRKMKNSIFSYEAPSTTLEFKPTAFSDISKYFEIKMECIQVFASQEKRDYTEREAIVNLCKFRGKIVNVEYAEAFEVLRLIEW